MLSLQRIYMFAVQTKAAKIGETFFIFIFSTNICNYVESFTCFESFPKDFFSSTRPKLVIFLINVESWRLSV